MSDDAQPRTFEDWLRRRREREEVRREVQEALELARELGWEPPELNTRN